MYFAFFSVLFVQMGMKNKDVIHVRLKKTPRAKDVKAHTRAPTDQSPRDMSVAAILAELKQLLASQQWRAGDGAGTRVWALSASLDAHISDGPALTHRIQAAIRKGVPLWNSGDYAGCAALYRAVATTHRAEHPALDSAVRECDGAPISSAGNSQGWIIRRAFDLILSEPEPTTKPLPEDSTDEHTERVHDITSTPDSRCVLLS